MRIHLGHHFYGAGNLGDDFMLAGFLMGIRHTAPDATFTGAVPFPLAPLQNRFPEIVWKPYDDVTRCDCIRDCDVWLGVGGSPFQAMQSRWFIDHLAEEAALCRRHKKPMYFLGVGIQTDDELALPEVREICRQADGIWTRDALSAERLSLVEGIRHFAAAADLAHIYFNENRPPKPVAGRLTLVANFDYAAWPGLAALLTATRNPTITDRVWLAQESRELPGAERSLYHDLSESEQAGWRLLAPDSPGSTLNEVLQRWPTGEWLVSARYHAALAGAWSGSKVVVISTNNKLRAAAIDTKAHTIPIDADAGTIIRALRESLASAPPLERAAAATASCRDFVNRIRSVGVR